MTGSASPFESAMGKAIALAREAAANGDVPIGAVVLDPSGKVIGKGSNQREQLKDPTAHAEVLALRAASAASGTWHLDDCTLVVTLEPCTMCAGALVLARVARVVFGAWNEEMGAVGTLWDVVRDRRLNHRPEVVSGVMTDECGELVRDFFGEHRDSKPESPIR